MQTAEQTHTEPIPELYSNIGIHGFCQHSTRAISDIYVMDIDAPSSCNQDTTKVLACYKCKMHEITTYESQKDSQNVVAKAIDFM